MKIEDMFNYKNLSKRKGAAVAQIQEIWDAGFMHRVQAKTTAELILGGGDGDSYIEVIAKVHAVIAEMTTVTDKDADEPSAALHYFHPAGDWWIIAKDVPLTKKEKSAGMREQSQALGYARLSGMPECAEYGYIDLGGILAAGGSFHTEMDYHWDASQTMKSVIEKLSKS